MIRIDGAQKSGSGTIVRFAVALASLLNDELHLTNIRAKREKLGLRPQHLQAVEALRECCQSAKWDTFVTEHFGIVRRCEQAPSGPWL